MKWFWHVLMAVLVVTAVLPIGLAYAQKSLPQVPVTYPGDTNETIARRAQWIESARKEGEMVWWGILSPSEGGKVIAEFAKVYPFIKITYWRGQGEEIAAKIEAEYAGGHPSFDITIGGEATNFPRWRKLGILEKFTDIIMGIKTLDRRMYSRYQDWAQPGNSGITPAYNTNLVSAADAPKSWEGLLDPKWRGQMAITQDMKVWLPLAVEEGGWGIEKTEDFLQKLGRQQLIWGVGHPAAHSLLMAGDFKIMGESYVYHTLQAQEKGAPVEWSRVNPVIITGPTLMLSKKAPHPFAAKLFLEWLFSAQGLIIYDRITYNGAASPGSGTRLSRALDGLHLIYRSEEGTIKAVEMGLAKKFAKIVGLSKE